MPGNNIQVFNAANKRIYKLMLVGTSNAQSGTITMPTGSRSGDFAIVSETRVQLTFSNSCSTPTGWTVILNQARYDSGANANMLCRVVARILTAGGSYTFCGSDVNTNWRRTHCAVFRPIIVVNQTTAAAPTVNAARVSAWEVAGQQGSIGTTDPSPLTISNGYTSPIDLMFFMSHFSNESSSSTSGVMTPSDFSIETGFLQFTKSYYKFIDSNKITSATMDMGLDSNRFNSMQGCVIKLYI